MTLWMSKMIFPNLVIGLFFVAYILGELRSLFAKVLGNKMMTRFGPKYQTPIPYQENHTKKQERIIWIKRQFIWFDFNSF